MHHLVELGLLGGEKQYDFGQEVTKKSLTPLGAALLKITDIVDDREWGMAEILNSVDVIRQSEIKQHEEEEEEKHAQRTQAYDAWLRG